MISIVHELRKAKGSNAKLAILKAHDMNTKWKGILVAMYDDSLNYYVGAPKDITFVADNSSTDEMLEELSFLSSRSITGNNAKRTAINMSRKYGEILRLILGRSLKAGVSVTTINKAYPNLIPTFNVMLAKKDVLLVFPLMASIKYDGVRAVVNVENGQATVYARSGKIIQIDSLVKEAKMWMDGWYDGELVSGDGKQVTRTKITGAVNKILLGKATDLEDYTFCVFDHLTLEEWSTKVCLRDFSDRVSFLKSNIK